jgi:hypothetical protein
MTGKAEGQKVMVLRGAAVFHLANVVYFFGGLISALAYATLAKRMCNPVLID